MPMKHRRCVNSVTLTALRRRRGLRSGELDRKSGRDEGTLSRLEGKEDLSWELLVEMAAVKEMDYDLEEVESAAFGLARATEPARIPESPIPVTGQEIRAIRRAAGTLGRATTEAREELLIRELRAEKVREAREKAEALCKTLLGAQKKMRRLYIEREKDYRTWEVAERLCEQSTMAARKSARLVLEIARLAYRVAVRVPGDERWRARVCGFCLAFVANAWRILGKLKKAERLFQRALELWEQGWDPDHIFPEWRLPDLLASLRRDQRRFPEALELHKRAHAAASKAFWGRILVNKASALNQMADPSAALEVLEEAAPYLENPADGAPVVGVELPVRREPLSSLPFSRGAGLATEGSAARGGVGR